MQVDVLAKTVWNYLTYTKPLQKADCIIAMGSHDVRVAQKAAQLHLNGWAPTLVMTGGFGRLTHTAWNRPEAEIFCDVAIGMGVPKEKIIVENRSTNTGENIDFTMQLLKSKSIPASKIIMVHKPYMLRRAYATFKKHFPAVELIPRCIGLTYDAYPNEIVSKEEMINIMVGDTQRIKMYPSKGFQIEQEIPNKVWDAFISLANLGFTKYLIEKGIK